MYPFRPEYIELIGGDVFHCHVVLLHLFLSLAFLLFFSAKGCFVILLVLFFATGEYVYYLFSYAFEFYILHYLWVCGTELL
jgi:hypothetical protein